MGLINCRYSDFAKRIFGKRIFAYGAGKMLLEVEEEFTLAGIEIVLVAIADSSRRLWGTEINIFHQDVEVISPEYLYQEMRKDDILLVTSGAYEEIIASLPQSFQNIEIYIFFFMRAYDRDIRMLRHTIPQNKLMGEKIQIPKVIHYCWFGQQEIPKQYKQYISTWKKYCPEYEIKEWNESNCDININRYVREAYEEKKYGFVSDYFRLKIVYEQGGIYLDTDVEVKKNLDILLRAKAFAGFETEEYVNFGLGFGAVEGFPIIKEILAKYENEVFINKDGTLNLKTCPEYQTEILERHGLRRDGTYQEVEGMQIYPFRYCCTKSVRTGNIYDTEDSFLLHHYSGSWLGRDKLIKKDKRVEMFKKITI